MSKSIFLLAFLLLVSCTSSLQRPSNSLQTAAIEDWILALPAFEYHEETVEEFAIRVRSARSEEPRNHGLEVDELFVGGDGTMPSKVFKLNRASQTLTIRSFNLESPFEDEEVIILRRAGETWVRVSSELSFKASSSA